MKHGKKATQRLLGLILAVLLLPPVSASAAAPESGTQSNGDASIQAQSEQLDPKWGGITPLITEDNAVTRNPDPEAPEAWGAVPDDQQLYYHEQELAAFIHFGVNTFTGAEWGSGTEDPKVFNPTAMKTQDEADAVAERWVQAFKAGGFKRLILVAKHHDGFCSWPSAYTERDVASSSVPAIDVVLAVSRACTKLGMDMGIYLSPWDESDKSYGYYDENGQGTTKEHEAELIANGTLTQDYDYNYFYNCQLREILTNENYGRNGQFVEIWMDGAKGTGANAQDYDFDLWYTTIKTLQPNVRCFHSVAGAGIRWCGNESGLSGDETCWQKMDIDANGELIPTKNVHGATARAQGRANGAVWSISECDVSMRNGWFDGSQRSFDALINMYYNSVGHGAVWLLNVPPTRTGEFSDADVAFLQRLGAAIKNTYAVNFAAASQGAAATTTQGTERASATAGKFSANQVLDEDNDTYWTLQDGATSGQITIDLGQERTFDLISIQEYIPLGQRIASTTIEYYDGQWKTFGETTTVGYRRLVLNYPVTGSKVRITVTNTPECNGVPLLSSVGVYKASPDMEKEGLFPPGFAYLDDRDSTFTYTGSWSEYNNGDGLESTHKGSGTAGSKVTGKFTGTKFYVIGIVDPNHGPVEITIDGGAPVTVDTHASPRATKQVLYTSPDLEYGEHTIVMTAKQGTYSGTNKTYFDFDGIYYVDGRKGILEFSKSTYPVREGDTATITVKRSGGSQGEISFKVIDLPGSAVSGQHYNVVDKTITLRDGETEATVTASTIQGDAANKQFYLQITGVTGGALAGVQAITDINILDVTGEMTFKPAGETFTEDDPFLMPSAVGQTNKLEAEHMVLDSTGAAANKYIRIQTDANASGGKKVGWFETNNKAYLHYYAPKAGEYTLTLRYESGRSAGNLNTLNWRGDKVEDYAGDIPGTMSGGSLTYGEESFDFTVTEPGYGVLEFYADSHASPNIDWFAFQLKSVPPVLVDGITLTSATQTIYTNSDDPSHTVQLNAAVTPADADNTDLMWRSSKSSVAICDQNGLVTAVGNGTAAITATATDGSGVSATAQITVRTKVTGSVVISGTPKFGAVLMASVNQISHQGAIDGLTYQWKRDGQPIQNAESDTYTVDLADIDHEITVTVSASGYYEGERTSSAVTAVKADGPEVVDTLRYADCTEAGGDGKITGLNSASAYQYKAVGADENAWQDIPGTPGATALTGLNPGSYHVRVKETKTHTAGPVSRTLTILAYNAGGHDINIGTFDNGRITASASRAPLGETVVLTAYPAEGYRLSAGSLTVTGESGDVVEVAADGSFDMPNEDVTVTAEFETKLYTIEHDLPNINCNMEAHNHKVAHGAKPVIELTPDTGYELPQTVTVTNEDGSGFSGYTYRNGVITFTQGVTGNLTISGEGVLKTYTVTCNFTNVSTSNAPITVGHGTQLELTISPRQGYTLPMTPTITMGVTDLVLGTDYTYSSGDMTVTILPGKITGDVVITANGVRQVAELTGVTISGTEMEGRRLTATVEPAGATVIYQWTRVDGDTETDIPNASDSRYMLTEEDVGKTIKVKVTGIAGYGGELSSVPTGEIAADPTVAVTAVRLDKTAATVAVDGTVQLTATVEPGNATTKTVQWSSDNESVAVVSENGVVTALAEGTAVITVTTDSDGCTAECVVTVTPRQQDIPALPSVPTTTTTTTTTTTNPDGTTTTTVTDNKTGTVTETTKKDDGTVETVETKKDGTKTETTEKPDGTVETVETKKDGTVTETTKNTDGTVEAVETKPDGTVTETTEKPDGSSKSVETKPDGTVTATNTDAEGGKVEKVTTPEKDVTVTVTDAGGDVLAKVELPAEIPAVETRFADVPVNHWADEAIHNMAALEVVEGVGDNRFDMNSSMTRGALATVLSRMSDGQKGIESSFADVASDTWYADGIAWAARTGVVTGYSATEFGPNDAITREQLAVMLCRYARLLGMDTTADSATLGSFNDGSSTHGWAADSIAWCVDKGILKGMGNNTLAPTATATRAQVSVMLQRFIDLLHK